MFQKIVAVESFELGEAHTDCLRKLCHEYIRYNDPPSGQEETINRIGDADAILIGMSTPITAEILKACPNLRYIGLYCSLYDEKSSNIALAYCQEHGIVVKGVHNYSDNGVAEFCVSVLIQLLHGFGSYQWKKEAVELTDLKIGIVGLGATGTLSAHALQHFGADIRYYSRTRKLQEEERGIGYMPLNELLQWADVVSTHLHRNTILLHKNEFERMGNGKILMNTTVGPTFDVAALKEWLAESPDNYYVCDAIGMMGMEKDLRGLPNIAYTPRMSGVTSQCLQRLSEKVIENIRVFLEQEIQIPQSQMKE